jgi:hypothetical protein
MENAAHFPFSQFCSFARGKGVIYQRVFDHPRTQQVEQVSCMFVGG